MYVPRHFAETQVEVLHDLIRRYPLGTLVVATPDGPDASHVPFEIDAQPEPRVSAMFRSIVFRCYSNVTKCSRPGYGLLATDVRQHPRVVALDQRQ